MSSDIEILQNTPETSTDEPELSLPNKDADYIDLGVYIKKHLQAGDRAEDQAQGFGRRTTVHRWYAGAALKIVQDRETRQGKWVEWCRAHGFNLGTCYEAIRLHQRSGSVENVRNLTITEARKKYQTDRRTFTEPGAKPQPKKVAAKIATKVKYKETEPLKRLRGEFEKVVEAVAAVDEDEWKNADPDVYLDQIDAVIERLKQAKQAIRGAQKTARANIKATAKVTANASVGKGRGGA